MYDFTPVSLDRQEVYKALLAASGFKASDYSFVNIWGWRDTYGLEWAFENGMCWLRQTLPETVYWAPVGPWRYANWRDGVWPEDATRLIRVPEELAECWVVAGGVRLKEARGHWDYLYSVQELAELRGNRFHKKKNLFSQFERQNLYEYHSMTSDCVEDALELQERWCQWRDCESDATLVAENSAIERVLTAWDRLCCLRGGTIRVDGHVVAYTVAEALTKDTLVVHFEKGATAYKGIYQAINKLFLEKDGNGFELVNREQDLDDEGLRKAKLSYNPVGFVKKFEVLR